MRFLEFMSNTPFYERSHCIEDQNWNGPAHPAQNLLAAVKKERWSCRTREDEHNRACNGMHGLIISSLCQTIMSSSFPGRSLASWL